MDALQRLTMEYLYLGAPLIGIGTSAAYFFVARGTPTHRRLLASAHGVVLAGVFLYIAVASSLTSPVSYAPYVRPFYALLVVFAAAVAISLFIYPGRRWVHLLQLVQLPSAFFVWLFGTMAIAHDWP